MATLNNENSMMLLCNSLAYPWTDLLIWSSGKQYSSHINFAESLKI